ncbi:MAG: Asp-tRNA(Asn)/Glu-tRNA(Gln) amidotransferase subunit GatC [Chloroflexi bacterium]|nr:Asp-tRNA(Asn)/Glu-tRNA(Gln) amidotransferase subunit GatC [Chloroflexota bacterium]
MVLTQEEVEHVALLARVGLSGEEVERFREQLSKVLDFMETLRELDTSAIPPTAQVIARQNVERPDQPRPSMPREDTLANAPQRADDFFRVAPVFEGS